MYTAITNDIQVSVFPEFMADRSEPKNDRYFWSYTIEIANLGRLRVQLIARYWQITDANGRVEEVRGLGVVGEQPVLELPLHFGLPLDDVERHHDGQLPDGRRYRAELRGRDPTFLARQPACQAGAELKAGATSPAVQTRR